MKFGLGGIKLKDDFQFEKQLRFWEIQLNFIFPFLKTFYKIMHQIIDLTNVIFLFVSTSTFLFLQMIKHGEVLSGSRWNYQNCEFFHVSLNDLSSKTSCHIDDNQIDHQYESFRDFLTVLFWWIFCHIVGSWINLQCEFSHASSNEMHLKISFRMRNM